MQLRKPKGFTLIELLVVISILGILATLALASYGSAQARSRDSRRKTDIDAIRKALELAKQDTPGAYYYPSCVASAANCLLTSSATTPSLSAASGTPYMNSVPQDPKTNTGYKYIPSPTNCSTTSICTSYLLVACFENTNDAQKDTINDTTSCPTTGTVSYTVRPS